MCGRVKFVLFFLKASLWCRAVGAVGAVATRQRGPGFNTQRLGALLGAVNTHCQCYGCPSQYEPCVPEFISGQCT